MAYKNKTLQELYDITVNGFKEEFNTKFRLLPKSFLNVLAKVQAGTFMVLYKMIGWLSLQIFPDTADYEIVDILGKKINPLGFWGNLIGAGDPSPATNFVGKVKLNVIGSGTITTGTQLKNKMNGQIYLAKETVVVNKSDSDFIEIPIEAALAGTIGNLAIDDELKLVNPLGFVESKGLITEITESANDGESIESYRHRVSNRWRVHPQGGALSDYRMWSNDVDGVYQTYIYQDTNSVCGVLVYVCADEESLGSRIANSGLLKQVGQACSYDPATGKQRKPLCAVLDPNGDESFINVKSIRETNFDVYIKGYQGNAEEIKNNAQVLIDNYLKGREPYIRGLSVDNEHNEIISLNSIIAIVNEIATANSQTFETVNVRQNGQNVQNYTLGEGELAKLGKLYINGVMQ